MMPLSQFSLLSDSVPTLNASRMDPGSDAGFVNSWQAYLVEVAYHLRLVAATDPQALEALMPLPATGWSVSPHPGGLAFVEDFLAAMKRYGFSDDDTAAIYLAFFARVLGLLIIQSSGRLTPGPDPTANLNAYPTLTRLRPLLNVDEDKTTFEDALDDILINLERDFQRKLRPLRGSRNE